METVVVRENRKIRLPVIAGMVIVVLLLTAAAGFILVKNMAGSKVLTYNLTEPLAGVTEAKIDIDIDNGNLTIDRLTGSKSLLAGGVLQYLENQGVPHLAVTRFLKEANLTLRADGKGASWSGLPWAACNAATVWQIHLNPGVKYALSAHSAGGNIKLNLAGMAMTQVVAETGGGNLDVILPDNAASLSVTAKTGAGKVTVEIGSDLTGSSTVSAESGAGNVIVRLPAGVAARIHVSSGMGKVEVDSQYIEIDEYTFQSPDYDRADNKIEVTAGSGAGNVTVETK